MSSTIAEGLVDRIAQTIRERILTGEIGVGTQLRQAELADEFAVSRTPIREALRQLQSSGLVDVVPNRGAIVRIPSPWDVRHAYQVRAEIEGMAAGLAAERAGEQEIERLREANDYLREHTAASGADATSDRRRRNDLFHDTIIQTAGNPWVRSMVERIDASFPQYVSEVVLPGQDRRHELAVQQHEEILTAIIDRDAPAAREAMRRHVLANGEDLAQLYEIAAQSR